MTTVWFGEATGAIEGDYVLRPVGDEGFDVGVVEDGEIWWLQGPVDVTKEAR